MSQRVAFLHPDLGIGGAERLVVDAAVGLQKEGFEVEMFTSHCDAKHSFKETQDGTLKVHVHGDWLPRHIFGRLHALCALLRMLYLTLVLVIYTGIRRYDALFVDVLSGPIPLLRLLGAPVLFYCHFPDKLLCTSRTSFLKRLYRVPLDTLEERTTGAANRVLVNSNYTAGVFASAFPSLSAPYVLYPPVNLSQFNEPSPPLASFPECAALMGKRFFLSINRYERKKNIALAIQAFAQMLKSLGPSTASPPSSFMLVIAGGYDPRVAENVEHCKELSDEARNFGVQDSVLFLTSIAQPMKVALVRAAEAVLYTPTNEHFGIVPVEAMALGTPVIAVNSGGPKESIEHGHTGFLCEGTAPAFAHAMLSLVSDAALRSRVADAAPVRVRSLFSLDVFQRQLSHHINAIARKRPAAAAATTKKNQ